MFDKETRSGLTGFCEKYGGKVISQFSLKKNSTIDIGAEATAMYAPSSNEELCAVRSFLDGRGVRTVVVGNGSNMLFPDEILDAVVINLTGASFMKTEFDGNIVTAGSGVRLAGLITECCARGAGGLENLAGIPATVGGALVTNASYRSPISDYLVKVLVLDNSGREKWIEKSQIMFDYRSSSLRGMGIVLRAVFRLCSAKPSELTEKYGEHLAEKSKRQPIGQKTLGCIFKNPRLGRRAAGELIDKAGMKNAQFGGARISEQHANFIVNTGGATAADVKGLMRESQGKVRERFSVELEPEIEIL